MEFLAAASSAPSFADPVDPNFIVVRAYLLRLFSFLEGLLAFFPEIQPLLVAFAELLRRCESDRAPPAARVPCPAWSNAVRFNEKGPCSATPHATLGNGSSQRRSRGVPDLKHACDAFRGLARLLRSTRHALTDNCARKSRLLRDVSKLCIRAAQIIIVAPLCASTAREDDGEDGDAARELRGWRQHVARTAAEMTVAFGVDDVFDATVAFLVRSRAVVERWLGAQGAWCGTWHEAVAAWAAGCACGAAQSAHTRADVLRNVCFDSLLRAGLCGDGPQASHALDCARALAVLLLTIARSAGIVTRVIASGRCDSFAPLNVDLIPLPLVRLFAASVEGRFVLYLFATAQDWGRIVDLDWAPRRSGMHEAPRVVDQVHSPAALLVYRARVVVARRISLRPATAAFDEWVAAAVAAAAAATAAAACGVAAESEAGSLGRADEELHELVQLSPAARSALLLAIVAYVPLRFIEEQAPLLLSDNSDAMLESCTGILGAAVERLAMQSETDSSSTRNAAREAFCLRLAALAGRISPSFLWRPQTTALSGVEAQFLVHSPHAALKHLFSAPDGGQDAFIAFLFASGPARGKAQFGEVNRLQLLENLLRRSECRTPRVSAAAIPILRFLAARAVPGPQQIEPGTPPRAVVRCAVAAVEQFVAASCLNAVAAFFAALILRFEHFYNSAGSPAAGRRNSGCLPLGSRPNSRSLECALPRLGHLRVHPVTARIRRIVCDPAMHAFERAVFGASSEETLRAAAEICGLPPPDQVPWNGIVNAYLDGQPPAFAYLMQSLGRAQAFFQGVGAGWHAFLKAVLQRLQQPFVLPTASSVAVLWIARTVLSLLSCTAVSESCWSVIHQLLTDLLRRPYAANTGQRVRDGAPARSDLLHPRSSLAHLVPALRLVLMSEFETSLPRPLSHSAEGLGLLLFAAGVDLLSYGGRQSLRATLRRGLVLRALKGLTAFPQSEERASCASIVARSTLNSKIISTRLATLDAVCEKCPTRAAIIHELLLAPSAPTAKRTLRATGIGIGVVLHEDVLADLEHLAETPSLQALMHELEQVGALNIGGTCSGNSTDSGGFDQVVQRLCGAYRSMSQSPKQYGRDGLAVGRDDEKRIVPARVWRLLLGTAEACCSLLLTDGQTDVLGVSHDGVEPLLYQVRDLVANLLCDESFSNDLRPRAWALLLRLPATQRFAFFASFAPLALRRDAEVALSAAGAHSLDLRGSAEGMRNAPSAYASGAGKSCTESKTLADGRVSPLARVLLEAVLASQDAAAAGAEQDASLEAATAAVWASQLTPCVLFYHENRAARHLSFGPSSDASAAFRAMRSAEVHGAARAGRGACDAWVNNLRHAVASEFQVPPSLESPSLVWLMIACALTLEAPQRSQKAVQVPRFESGSVPGRRRTRVHRVTSAAHSLDKHLTRRRATVLWRKMAPLQRTRKAPGWPGACGASGRSLPRTVTRTTSDAPLNVINGERSYSRLFELAMADLVRCVGCPATFVLRPAAPPMRFVSHKGKAPVDATDEDVALDLARFEDHLEQYRFIFALRETLKSMRQLLQQESLGGSSGPSTAPDAQDRRLWRPAPFTCRLTVLNLLVRDLLLRAIAFWRLPLAWAQLELPMSLAQLGPHLRAARPPSFQARRKPRPTYAASSLPLALGVDARAAHSADPFVRTGRPNRRPQRSSLTSSSSISSFSASSSSNALPSSQTGGADSKLRSSISADRQDRRRGVPHVSVQLMVDAVLGNGERRNRRNLRILLFIARRGKLPFRSIPVMKKRLWGALVRYASQLSPFLLTQLRHRFPTRKTLHKAAVRAIQRLLDNGDCRLGVAAAALVALPHVVEADLFDLALQVPKPPAAAQPLAHCAPTGCFPNRRQAAAGAARRVTVPHFYSSPAPWIYIRSVPPSITLAVLTQHTFVGSHFFRRAILERGFELSSDDHVRELFLFHLAQASRRNRMLQPALTAAADVVPGVKVPLVFARTAATCVAERDREDRAPRRALGAPDLFEQLLELSGRALQIPPSGRESWLRKEVAAAVAEATAPGSPPVHFPFAPTRRILGAASEKVKVMQSAAKVPYLLTFSLDLSSDATPKRCRGSDPTRESQSPPEKGRPGGSSAFSGHKASDGRSIIFKLHDDIRQDELTMQFLYVFRCAFERAELPLYLRTYGVISYSGRTRGGELAGAGRRRRGGCGKPAGVAGEAAAGNLPGCTGAGGAVGCGGRAAASFPSAAAGGMIEVIPHTVSRHEIGAEHPTGGLVSFFAARYGARNSERYRAAQFALIQSLAAYAVACYVLQIKDRHNGNLLIGPEGHLIHIDFGFLFDLSPGRDLRLEKAPFKLTLEMIDLLGGCPEAPEFRLFERLVVQGYLALRDERALLAALLAAAVDARPRLPCFKKHSVARFQERMQLDASPVAAAAHMQAQVVYAYNAFSTRVYDVVQFVQQGIHR